MEWTKEDIDQLKTYINQYTVKEISKLMNRTQKSIYSKIKYLKLSITKNDKYWTESDIEKLVKMYAKGYDMMEIGHLLSRSEDGIIKKLWKIGITKSGRREWTKKEEEYLLDNAGKMNFKYMCKKLNRNPAAVKKKLYKIGANIKDNNGCFTLNQLSILSKKSFKYLAKQIENYELLAQKKAIVNGKNKIYIVKGEDFWDFAWQHKKDFRFSLIEKDSIPVEPDWVEKERGKEEDIYINKSWSTEQTSELKALFKAGYDYEYIAKRMHRNKDSICSKLYKLGLKRIIQINFSKDELEIIFDMLREGKKTKEIANEIGRSYDQVKNKLSYMRKKGSFEYYTNKAKMPKVRSIMTDDAEIGELLNIINR